MSNEFWLYQHTDTGRIVLAEPNCEKSYGQRIRTIIAETWDEARKAVISEQFIHRYGYGYFAEGYRL